MDAVNITTHFYQALGLYELVVMDNVGLTASGPMAHVIERGIYSI